MSYLLEELKKQLENDGIITSRDTVRNRFNMSWIKENRDDADKIFSKDLDEAYKSLFINADIQCDSIEKRRFRCGNNGIKGKIIQI